MADLLTATERAEIASSIQDVTDTFFKKQVTLVKATSGVNTLRLTPFNEKRTDKKAESEIPLTGLLVPRKKDDDAEASTNTSGTLDDSQSELYFNYQDLLTNDPVLITDDGQADIVPNKDQLKSDGVTYDIIGVNLVGPREDIFFLVKLHLEKQMTTENPTT